MELFRDNLEPTHPTMVEARQGVARMQAELNQHPEALVTLRALVADIEALPEFDPMLISGPLKDEARVLLALDRPAEALVRARRAVEIYRAADGAEPQEFVDALLALADALWRRGDKAAARRAASQAVPFLQDAQGEAAAPLQKELKRYLEPESD